MIKQLAKRALNLGWTFTRPLRRPFANKLHRFLDRCFQQSGRHLTEESNVLMNHMIRELVRLQHQVELLQQSVDDLSQSTALHVVRADDDSDARRAG
jgi:hypothetical protein